LIKEYVAPRIKFKWTRKIANGSNCDC